VNYGHLEKLPFPRVRAQVGAVEAMSLNCWVPLETEFFEVPLYYLIMSGTCVMNFIVLQRGTKPPKAGLNTAYLTVDHWNDFSFVTMFYLELHDDIGSFHSLGNVKIGFRGQTTEQSTYSLLGDTFQRLPSDYFSIGQDVDYYKRALLLPKQSKEDLLSALQDIIFIPGLLEIAQREQVFRVSLLRSVSLSVIKGQFSRVLEGRPPLTDFKFSFTKQATEEGSALELSFKVRPESKPSTNIHAIIGRNGVGKTTLLNGMIEAITSKGVSDPRFYDMEASPAEPIAIDYFSSLVSVSFSAFDPFEPPQEQPNPSLGTCYFYLGLKKARGALKSLQDLQLEFLNALKTCLSQVSKRDRLLKAIEMLESDDNFACMRFRDLLQLKCDDLTHVAQEKIKCMSSGHAVVLLTITRLVATVEEKTLVLIDEPESHLHPPLLSAFIRALSELLHDRNAVSIIATHSPVVLQEVPRSSVWKINRVGMATHPRRPDIETFGENVGIITREVFGLEVVNSGFHDLLTKSVESGKSYHEIVDEYNEQLGLEARALLKVLITHRDRTVG
jgi:predicted ATPase